MIVNYIQQKLNKGVTFLGHTVLRESPSVVSPDPCWVCLYNIEVGYGPGQAIDSMSCYGHFNNSLFGLIKELVFEYGNDKHLIGY